MRRHSLLVGFALAALLATSHAAPLPRDREVSVMSGGEVLLSRGPSPLHGGKFHQYEGLTTPLRGNLIISDTLLPTDKWHSWDGKPVQRFDISKQSPENYHGAHNHHQNVFSQVINATRGANGIPFWGDGIAVVNGANAWGGFFSARSGCHELDLIGQYLPKSIGRECGPEFDAQITGLEVDVINAGKPGVFPNKAKHGIQIVGFGNPNGQALSVIAKDFDRPQEFRAGQFESILYAQNSIQPEYGRFIVADFDAADIGIDFRKPVFHNGAVVINSSGMGTGIIVNEGKSGEIYGGIRWPKAADPGNWQTIRIGEAGLRIVSNDNMRELLTVDNAGRIALTGEVSINDQPLVARSSSLRAWLFDPRTLVLVAGLMVLQTGISLLLFRKIARHPSAGAAAP